MIDLPVFLDDPARLAASETPSTARAVRPQAAAATIAWPWWMAPARLVGRIRPALLSAAESDARAFSRLPMILVALIPPLVVIAFSLVLSISNASTVASHASPHVDWLRFGADAAYTESPPFLLMAVVVGALSPALGVFLVGFFGVTDIIAATYGPYELHPFPSALFGRLIALWLLWLVAVEIPIVGRQLGLSWQRVAGNRFMVAALTGLASGAFVWVWTQATVALIRPLFTWSHLVSSVTLEAVQPLQTAGLVFAVAGGLVAGGSALLRGPDGLFAERAVPPPSPVDKRPQAVIGRALKRVVVAGLLTVSLGGLITWPLEAVTIFAVLLGARPLARLVADRTPVGTIVGALPPVARYAIAAVLSFGAAQLTIAPLYRAARIDTSGRYPEFFSVIAAVSIGLILVEIATTPSSRRWSPASLASSAAVVVALLGTLVLITLAAPVGVVADNCAGLGDCWGTPFLAALAGGALPLAMSLGKNAWDDYKSSKYRYYETHTTERAVLGVRG